MNKKVFVGNLNFKCQEDELVELFSEVGSVQHAKIVFDRESGRSKGFAFVEFSSSEEAAAAIEKFNKYEFSGREMIVSEAREKVQRN